MAGDPVLMLPGGGALLLRPGRRFAARVLRVEAGRAVVSLAGDELTVGVAPGARLAPGQTVRLAVARVGEGRVALRLDG